MAQTANGWSKFVAIAGLFFTILSLLAFVAREVAEKLDQRITRLETDHKTLTSSVQSKIDENVGAIKDDYRNEDKRVYDVLDAELKRLDSGELGDLYKLREQDQKDIIALRERTAKLEEALKWIREGRRMEPSNDP